MFDDDYADIAAMLEKTEAACRQLVHRAQARVQQEQPRFKVAKDAHRDLLATFMQAASTGDRTAMKALMSDGVQLVADGGGKVNSFHHILYGAGRVAGVYWSLEHQFPGKVSYRQALVNGEARLLRYVDGKLESVQSFVVDGGQIVAVFGCVIPTSSPRCHKLFEPGCHNAVGPGVLFAWTAQSAPSSYKEPP